MLVMPFRSHQSNFVSVSGTLHSPPSPANFVSLGSSRIMRVRNLLSHVVQPFHESVMSGSSKMSSRYDRPLAPLPPWMN